MWHEFISSLEAEDIYLHINQYNFRECDINID